MNNSFAIPGLLGLVAALLLAGCGGGGDSSGGDPATHLAVSGLPSAASGRVPIKFTVSALDASNRIVVGYSGTVHVTSTDASAALPSDLTLINGAGMTQASLVTAGAQTLTVTDTAGVLTAVTSAAITVTASPPPVITSSAPPNGTAGLGYNAHTALVCTQPDSQFTCIGWSYETVNIFPFITTGGPPTGNVSFSWSAQPGSRLPQGLELLSASIYTVGFNGWGISGTPQQAGSYAVTVTVTDNGSPAAKTSANYTIVIQNPQPPSFAMVPGPQGATLNQNYGYAFSAGSVLPITFSESGPLPPGLSLSPQGWLSGVPTSAGSFPITVTATDGAGQASAQNFTLQVFQHGWSFSYGGLLSARANHTATLMSTGNVLLTGGISGTAVLASAEVYDPVRQLTAATSAMQAARVQHTATLLCDLSAPTCANPLVLIAGGNTSTVLNDPTNGRTAELYDPTAGTFTSTGNMNGAHYNATATLLTNGQVLIAGGDQVAVADRFDPVTHAFLSPVNMQAVREHHTATLLPSGQVLITGGVDQIPSVQATAELYDPATATFASVGTMTVARAFHTATLLADGRVLIVGGFDAKGTELASAELYDPVSGTFTATGNLVTARDSHTAGLLPSGQILIVGGYNGAALPHAELFDPLTGTFSNTGSLQIGRRWHTLTVLGGSGQALVVGGSRLPSAPELDSIEVYQ